MATIVGKFEITVEQFRPVGSITTTAISMKMTNDTDSNLFKKDGEYSITVRPDTGPKPQPVDLEFTMMSRGYVILGVTFTKRNFTHQDKVDRVGEENFTNISIAKNQPGDADAPESPGRKRPSMTVTNSRQHKGSYDYMIFIQEVKTGNVGVIDPEIKNEDW